VVRVGRLLRVPRVELEKLVGGPIMWPLPGPPTVPVASVGPASNPGQRTSRPRRAGRANASQLVLLDGD
jgi:hypothetical protein